MTTDTLAPLADALLPFPEGIDGETAVQALRHSEAYFRALVENARDVIHVINEDRTTRYITPSVRHLLGWEPAELVGRSVLDFIHPDDVEAALGQIRQARITPGSSQALTLRVRHRDGSWRVFEAIGRNLLDDPRVRGIIVNSRDVTGRQRAEEESARLAAILPSPLKWKAVNPGRYVKKRSSRIGKTTRGWCGWRRARRRRCATRSRGWARGCSRGPTTRSRWRARCTSSARR